MAELALNFRDRTALRKERDLASYLNEAALRFPAKPGLIFEDQQLSYFEICREARHRARKLIAAGVTRGDRVALHMYNGPDLAISYYACFLAGAIAVPINTRMKAKEIEYVLKHSGASIYLGQTELFREIGAVRPNLSRVRQFVTGWRELKESPMARLPAVSADWPAAILYTSGSTARPKGAVHTHSTLLNAALGLGLHRNDTATIVTPMVHAAAFLALIASVHAAATAVIVARFDADAVLDAIARHRGTYMMAMPAMYWELIRAQKARPRDLRYADRFTAGGDAVPLALKGEFVRCFGRPLNEGFGMTETGIVAVNWSQMASHAGSFGLPVAGVEAIIVNADGDRAPAGIVGELAVRSAGTMAGYWNGPDDAGIAAADDWFHTGDLVYQDHGGYLYFVGRKKLIIVRAGSNISPSEVEAVLYQHPGVREAGVAGIPDAKLGERVVAFVSREPGCMVSADELIGFVRERLAAYKTPEEIVFLDALPKNAAGKLQRLALRESYVLAQRQTLCAADEALRPSPRQAA